MKTRFVKNLVGALCFFLLVSNANAVTFFIDNVAGFNAALGGAVFQGTEDFESSNLAPNSILQFDDPLAPGVANGPFLTGTNPATGMTVQSNTLGGAAANPSPHGVGGLVTASAPFLGTPDDQVSNTFPGHSIDFIFSLADPVTAVSFIPLFFDDNAANGSTTE